MTNISSIRRAACRAVSLEDIVPDGEHASPADASAVLIARNGRDVQISRDGCVSEARVAFGCVVQPEPGDRVLIGMADGTIWVTSVLERSSDAPMRLWAEGDVSIISMRGDVSLMAARCVNLDAGERAGLRRPRSICTLALPASCSTSWCRSVAGPV